MNDMKEVKARAVASTIMWLGYLVIVYLAMTLLEGGWSVFIAFVVMMPLIAATGMMWGAFTSETDNAQKENLSAEEIEKRKRERIDSVLRDLSDDDLLRLKQRLGDGVVNDEVLYSAIVSDDGELVYK